MSVLSGRATMNFQELICTSCWKLLAISLKVNNTNGKIIDQLKRPKCLCHGGRNAFYKRYLQF